MPVAEPHSILETKYFGKVSITKCHGILRPITWSYLQILVIVPTLLKARKNLHNLNLKLKSSSSSTINATSLMQSTPDNFGMFAVIASAIAHT